MHVTLKKSWEYSVLSEFVLSLLKTYRYLSIDCLVLSVLAHTCFALVC